MRLMFADEARFGRMRDPRSCWAPAPHRPVVNLALVREFRYEYAAVSPWDGCLDYMTVEKMNTDSMTRFLAQVSAAHSKEFIVMVLDGASSHRSKELKIPDKLVTDTTTAIFTGTQSAGTPMEMVATACLSEQVI